jgi:hypothetical protein
MSAFGYRYPAGADNKDAPWNQPEATLCDCGKARKSCSVCELREIRRQAKPTLEELLLKHARKVARKETSNHWRLAYRYAAEARRPAANIREQAQEILAAIGGKTWHDYSSAEIDGAVETLLDVLEELLEAK